MTIAEAIELLLNRMNTRKQFVGGTFGGFAEGTVGNLAMQQRDMNKAIELWQTKHDATSLVQMTNNLHAYGNLTDDEYQQIMDALDGEN
jgi:hypothetical protein